MVQLTAFLSVLALSATALSTLMDSANAHPGHHDHTRSLVEIAQRRLFHQNTHRSLAACANHDASMQLNEQAAQRRAAKIAQLRADLQQRKRQLRADAALSASTALATSHKSNLTGISPTSVTATTLFGSTNKCVLEPEVTQGPYYVKGELIRNDVRETQSGIDLYAELQFIDTTSCSPVADYYVDFWHCNATGVYSGVVASGNGDSNDQTNWDATFMRGLAPTDSSGVVQFLTKFPGHYTGRTSHIHILGNHDGTVLANKTYVGGSVSSVGQIFFDQTLLTEISKTTVYAKNTQTVTLNSADSILSESAATGFDPVVQYVYLGDSVEDGVFAWISVGVDTSVAKSVSAAATLTASGGVANSNNNIGGIGGGGMGGGPGSAPGGASSGPPGSMAGTSTTAPGNTTSGSSGSTTSGSSVSSEVTTSSPSTPTTSAAAETGIMVTVAVLSAGVALLFV